MTATTDTKTYDATTSSAAIPTITAGTLVGTDTGSFTQTFDTPTWAPDKTLTPAGSISDGNGGANYAITFVNDITGVISQWAVTVTADSGQAKIYGTPDPTLTYTVTSGSLQPGDSFSGPRPAPPVRTSASPPSTKARSPRAPTTRSRSCRPTSPSSPGRSP